VLCHRLGVGAHPPQPLGLKLQPLQSAELFQEVERLVAGEARIVDVAAQLIPRPPRPAPQIGHLDSLGGILAEMSCVYREMRMGTTKLDTGTKLVYVLSTMRATLEAMALERIERRLNELEPRGGHGHQGNDQPALRPN